MEMITVDHDGPILEIMLNRPEKRNAINHQMIMEIDNVLRDSERADGVRVIVFRGSGPAFSGGHDFQPNAFPMAPGRERTSEERTIYEIDYFYSKALYLRDYPKPTIAAVHGPCVAAALMLSQACDLVVASDDAYFSNPVGRMGAPGVELLLEAFDMGIRRAKQFLFTGDRITAQQALAWGMVNEVVPAAELPSRAKALANRIALMPPMAIQLTKKSLNHTQDLMGFRLAQEAHLFLHLLGHSTEEALSLMADARNGRSVKEFIAYRDAKWNDLVS